MDPSKITFWTVALVLLQIGLIRTVTGQNDGACDCGKNVISCYFEDSNKVCDCENGFTDINGQCADERCVDECGVDKETICKVIEEVVTCHCEETKKFDNDLKKCRIGCNNDSSCVNGGECIGDEMESDSKFCDCLAGTSGDACEIIDSCVTGKFKNCSGEKGNCSYDSATGIVECKCEENRKLMDESGYCEVCDCGDNADECMFVEDIKTCSCKANYSENYGLCVECQCGVNSEKCSFVDGEKTCVCEDGYADNKGTCEACDCGVNSKKCSFVNGVATCTCEQGYSVKNGKCEECDCGENTLRCSFVGDDKICKCNTSFSDNGGKCEACDCGKNSTKCIFKDGAKICSCKKDNAQNEDKCEVCKCGRFTKPCKFEDGHIKCDCIDKYAEKDGKCKDCECGVNSTGCTFEEDNKKTCDCHTGYGDKSGKCIVDNCYKKCGVDHEEGHPDVECKGDRFDDIKDIKCICEDQDLKFDTGTKKCRAICSKKEDCKNGAACRAVDGVKFCICLNGTTGNDCATVIECESDGQLAKCKGDKGDCKYIAATKKPSCECTPKKAYDNSAKYCQNKCKTDADCKEENKICYTSSNNLKYCTCEKGKSGDKCEINDGCSDELKKKCEEAGAACVFDENETNKATCQCDNEDFAYKKDKNICTPKFCNDIGCNGAACVLDVLNKIGSCKCSGGKYYDYKKRECTEPDKCLLKKTPCQENEVCENGKCDCKNGEKDGDKCIKKFCKGNACFKGANCTEDSRSCQCEEGKFFTGTECKETKCILDGWKDSCDCPRGMTRNDKSKACEPSAGKKACATDCGLGYCVDDKCVCVGPFSKLHENKCVLAPETACASKKLTADLSKCDCTEKYKQAKDGVTCELVTCSDEVAKNDCRSKGALCIMNWTGNKPGYDCSCPSGYILDTDKGICTDPCSKYENILKCRKENKVCYNSYSSANPSTFECGCPPPFKLKDGACTELAPDLYLISGIPVMKDKYEKDNVVDYVTLNAHLMQSLSQTFSADIFDSGYLSDYVIEDKILSSSVWVRFKKDPKYELQRIPIQAQNFESNETCEDCDPNLFLLPPHLLLSKSDIGNVQPANLTLCSDVIRNKMCGKDAMCEDNKCYCPRGFRAIEYTIQDIGNDARILRCEASTGADLDECAVGTHSCPNNTNCAKIPGSYICKCKPGFKKDTENDRQNCVDLCTPSPCGKGTCSMKKDKFNCKCQQGYGGSICDEPDVNYAAAKKSTVVVGAVLGTILILVTLAVLFFYIKKRKNSYSEDFMSAPRQDHASEMRERRPMRGVVNTSYE